MHRVAAVSLASLVFPASILSAQQPPPVEVGQRVRATHCAALAVYSGNRRTDCGRTDGNLVAIGADSIVLATGEEDAPVTIPRDLMTRIDVRGRGSAWKKGAVIGGLVGVGVGAAAGAVLAGFCEMNGGTGQKASECRPAAMAGGGIVVGALGALLGAGIGALGETDRWEEVPLDRIRVSLAPYRKRVGIVVSVTF